MDALDYDCVFVSFPCSGRNWVSDIYEAYKENMKGAFPKILFTHDVMEPPNQDIQPWYELREVGQYDKPTALLTRDHGM